MHLHLIKPTHVTLTHHHFIWQILFIGSVIDGQNWFEPEYFQNTTSELHATIAIDITHEPCIWNDELVPVPNNLTWTTVSRTLYQESKVLF